MAERSKAHAWKVCIRETVSRVRIPLSPPTIRQAVVNAQVLDFNGSTTARLVRKGGTYVVLQTARPWKHPVTGIYLSGLVGIHNKAWLCFTLWMDRFILTDAQWAKIEPHCLGRSTDPGRSGSDNRLFLEAVLWIVRTGSPWRDLPAHFGNWSTAFRRFSDWRRADVFKRSFDALSDEPDMEYAMVDATIVKVHRHGQGAKGGLRARPSAAPRAA